MELYIDNILADTDAASTLSMSLAVAVATDPRQGRAGYTRTMRLPATPTNDSIFSYAAEVHAKDKFNATPHIGRVEHEGCVLIEGPLILSRTERGGNAHSEFRVGSQDGTGTQPGFYEVHVLGAAREWASHAGMHHLSTLPIDCKRTLSASTIANSWTENSPVRFFPVARERLRYDYSSGSVIPAAKVLSSDDYHPFLHAATLLETIFNDAGYRVESDFMHSAAFNDIYISGNYPMRDVSVARADMDFLARRLAPSTATANSLGRAFADPNRSGTYTLGNIVDTADTTVTGPDGTAYEDVFSNGGCFQMDEKRVGFIPPRATSVGFQYHLRYTTDYRMKSRTEMAGFDTIFFGEQNERRFTLANPWTDRRPTFRSDRSYKLAVFDHVAGCQYQLVYTRHNSATTTSTGRSAIVSNRLSLVEINTTLPVSSPVLWWRASSASAWQIYNGDWALYDGFVGETGTLDVELTVRTAPEEVTDTAPKFFDDIYFGGADPGMKITLSEKTWLRPVFYAQPTEGTDMTFGDVCAHEASRMDFINALRQMFDLCFHTDNRERVVRIEPTSKFYDSSRIVDWSNRLDLSKPVTVEELGGDLSREMVWSYHPGDGATMRYNRNNGGHFGRWSTVIESTAAFDETALWENPLFAPSLSVADIYYNAPAARLLQTGDLSIETLERTENLNFVPKVVRYEGMTPLPAGQTWGWPRIGTSYPLAAFHSPESGYTLCFEDRDGCKGLHSMWDSEIKLWNKGRRLTLWLVLDAADISSLSFPAANSAKFEADPLSPPAPDFRALYKLTIDGEECLYRLEEVCDYSPTAPSTKCVFVKHIS
jgi:hypothetical protein